MKDYKDHSRNQETKHGLFRVHVDLDLFISRPLGKSEAGKYESVEVNCMPSFLR